MGAGIGLVLPYDRPDGSVPAYRAGYKRRRSWRVSQKTFGFNPTSNNVTFDTFDMQGIFVREGSLFVPISVVGGFTNPSASGLQVIGISVGLYDNTTSNNDLIHAWNGIIPSTISLTGTITTVPSLVGVNFNLPILRYDDFADIVKDFTASKTGNLSKAKLVLSMIVNNTTAGTITFDTFFAGLYYLDNLAFSGQANQPGV